MWGGGGGGHALECVQLSVAFRFGLRIGGGNNNLVGVGFGGFVSKSRASAMTYMDVTGCVKCDDSKCD